MSPQGNVSVGPLGVVNSRVGDVVELSCEAGGGPNNMFTWTANGVQIADSQGVVQSISSALDGGEYQCQVQNMAGSGTASVTINGSNNCCIPDSSPL